MKIFKHCVDGGYIYSLYGGYTYSLDSGYIFTFEIIRDAFDVQISDEQFLPRDIIDLFLNTGEILYTHNFYTNVG